MKHLDHETFDRVMSEFFEKEAVEDGTSEDLNGCGNFHHVCRKMTELADENILAAIHSTFEIAFRIGREYERCVRNRVN